MEVITIDGEVVGGGSGETDRNGKGIVVEISRAGN